MRRTALLATAAVLAALAAAGQEPPPRLPPADSGTVSVDVVVRDGKGRLVTDLVATDFEVLEDGVPQAIDRFVAPPEVRGEGYGAVAGPPRGSDATAVAVPSPPVAPPPATIAFVFDRLSTEGRLAAQRAVREAMREKRPADVAGVFSVEATLVVLQDFTADPEKILAAAEALGSRVAHSGPTRHEQAVAATGQRMAAASARATFLSMPEPRTAEQGLAKAMAGIESARLSVAQAAADAFERLARDEAGQTTAHALTAIVDALRGVPGRKSVVLFSEGLFRTEANERRFLSVVHSANRASVSVYAIEASGLQTHSQESLTRAGLESTANVSMARQASGQDVGGGAFTRDLEAVEDAVRFSPRASLEWIADATGGVFVRDTNDLPGALRRAVSDARSYYLLGYAPRNATFDGRFRRLAVRVARRDVEVRSRSGYFAVRSEGPVLAHVAPALALLESGERPRDVELHAGGWPFPADGGPARVPVSVSVPSAAVARLGRETRKRPLDVTLLVRLRDAEGRVVDALSRRYLVDPAKPGDLLLLRDAWLAPGRYTVEAVALEAQLGRSGVVVSEVEVRGGRRAIDRPQLVVVRQALPVAEVDTDLETGHPLRFGDVVLLPLAGESLALRPARPLVFQLAAPAGTAPAGVAVLLEVRRDGRTLVQQPLRWPVAGPDGLQRLVGEAPFTADTAGVYELCVTLSDAEGPRVLRAEFEVAERPR